MTDDESSVLGLHSTLSDASESEAAAFGTNSTSTRQWFDGSILDELMKSSLGNKYHYLINMYQGEKETTFSFDITKKLFRVSKNQLE